MPSRAYKRSWRNLLLDTEYQLIFTTVMVVTCAAFMGGLGWLVHKEAAIATMTAVQDVKGQPLLDPALAAATIEELEARRVFLDRLLVGVGLALAGGLFLYGLKMTHRVAGPVYKIGLYCDKVAGGKFDTLHNLRRGDQLVEFYEHFKQAHGALRAGLERDVACLRAAVAAAEEAELAGRSPELAARLDDLRTVLARKEASLG
jgi:hypothetical protein